MTESPERSASPLSPADACQWTPTPKYILRRACIRTVTADWAPGRFVELGAGSGDLTSEFLARGFDGVCYDLGARTRELLRARLAGYGARAQVVDDIGTLQPGSFGYLFAFEVLEHIVDDVAALERWTRLLQRGGRCVISVPAHQRKYGADDAAVGHVRRYEKAQIRKLLEGCGYDDIHVRNYGFPLGNLTRLVANRMQKTAGESGAEDAVARSIRSGVEQPRLTRKLSAAFNGAVLAPFTVLQRAFFSLDWGDGYVLSARKSRD